VRADDRAIEAVIDRLPASSSKDHGRLFYDLFKEHGDFYKIDPLLFSPAQVTLVNAASGRVWSAGVIDEAMLRKSFGIDG
jgi:methenyltetrahydromethanopterin cyclohydrolase